MSPNDPPAVRAKAREPTFGRRLLSFNLQLFGVLSGVVFALGTGLWMILVPALSQRLEYDTRYLADRLGRTLDIAAAAQDASLVQEVLHEIRADPDFQGMVLTLEGGGTLFEVPAGFAAEGAQIRRTAAGTVYSDADRFGAWAPIEVEGVPLGVVTVAYSKKSLHMLRHWFVAFATVMVLFFVASLVFAHRFDLRFVAPFRKLTVFAARIGAGHLGTRLESELGAAESRDLVGELNRMAMQLQTQHEALVQAREEALGASRAKSRFLANMSHEIRTPLNGVLGTADLMLMGTLSAEVRADVEVIRLSATGLLAIIEDILDLAKIEADRVAVESVPTDLVEVLHGALAAVVPQTRKRGLALHTALAPGVPRFVRSDGLRVRQILVNILGNAAKFTEQGAIRLEVDVQGDRLEMRVRDDGIGMTPEQLEVIFEAFRQGDVTTTRRFGGTGLGLAISRRLAELLGGRLTAESTPGVGTTMCLELPLIPTDDPDLLTPPPVRVLGADLARDHLAACFAAAGVPESELAPKVVVVCLSEPEELEAHQEALTAARRRGGRVVAVLPPDTLSARRLLERGEVDVVLTEPVFPSQILGRARTAGTEAVVEPTATGPGLRVLLAEDNPVNQMVATRMLARLGHEVLIAGDGAQALAQLQAPDTPVDVVLMDLHMPVMDGFEATRALRRSGHTMPVIALTADAMRGTDAQCRAAGMDGYVAKPLQLEDLRRALAPIGRAESPPMARRS